MTPDDIKVGDRFLVPVEARETAPGDSNRWYCRTELADGMFLGADFLSTCQLLPPEIGVGDEVRHKKWEAHCKNSFVRAIADGWAWVAEDVDDEGLAYLLSDLSLVKKAEKD